jgi:hypothetical protein
MKIACLGWGSLIWKPEELLISGEWLTDGPFLPIEFVRQSKDGRLTLAITESAKPIRILWSLMTTNDLELAKNSLRIREQIPEKRIIDFIGVVKINETTNNHIESIIKEWAVKMKLDAVIWTNLPAKFNDTNTREPTLNEAIDYLKSLDLDKKSTAEEYIRKAPKQIDTEFRKKFVTEFGWTNKN